MARIYIISIFILAFTFSQNVWATGRAGQCGSAHGGSFATAPTIAATMCARGLSSTAVASGSNWVWTCQGSGTAGNANCSATNCAPDPTINGTCKAYGSNYASQPASSTASGCTAGTYAEYADTASLWRWQCTGSGTPAGTTATCSANKTTTVNGACKTYASTYGAQPATDTASGCTAGTYADVSDTSTLWKWNCSGSGTPAGTTANCTADVTPAEPCLAQSRNFPGETSCPTQSCFFWVSGVGGTYMNGASALNLQAKIGDDTLSWFTAPIEAGSDVVGAGDYADTYGTDAIPGIFRRASNGSLDSIALGPKTRVILYRDKNYAGGVVWDLTGPKVIVNKTFNAGSGMGTYWNSHVWPTESWTSYGPLLQQFPPSTRQWSATNDETLYWTQANSGQSKQDTNGTSVKVQCLP